MNEQVPSKEPVSHGPCASCGMIVASNEYHPFAACLMHEACRNSETVRANLNAVIDHGYKASRASHEPRAIELLRKVIAEGGGAEEWPEIAEFLAGAAQPPALDYGVTPTLAAVRMAIHTFDVDRNERRVLEEIQETVRHALTKAGEQS